MVGAQFTPAPWTVDDGGIRCGHGHNYGIVAQARDGHIYSEYTSDPATLEFENIADMHLVAAAPELYEACEHAREFIENGVALGYIRMPDPDCPDKAHKALPTILAALAKARGEHNG